jgi:hypothetical protein
MSQITATNKMSGRARKQAHGAIEFVKNPNTGKCFFTCGSIVGYVSPKVESNLDSVTLDDIQYAEVSIDGKPAVPCLMMKATNNVLKTL